MSDEILTVERIHTDTGSYIDPPMDEGWTRFQKLRWHAAVVAHDTGLFVKVFRIDFFPATYSIQVGRSSHSAQDYHSAWTYLNGVSVGIEQKART